MRIRPIIALVLALPLAAPAGAQMITRERLAQLRERVHRDSCDAALSYHFGRALASQGQWDAADSAFQRAVAINPQLAGAWVWAGVVQNRNRRHWDGLRRAGSSALEREHARRDAMVRRGLIIDPFLGLDEQPLVGLPRSGESFEFLDGMRQAALRHYGSLDSVPQWILWSHANAAARDVRYPAAIADMGALLRVAAARRLDDSALVVPMEATFIRYGLAVLYHLAGDRRTAAQLYREVLAEDIGNYMAHVQLARISEAGGDTAAGLRERQAASDANPEDHTLLLDLGVALQRAGQRAQAEQALRRARTLNSRDPMTHYRLGVLLDEGGMPDSARAALDAFLRVAPSGWTTPIADARQRLARTP